MAEARVRIRRVAGQWYAFGSGPRKQRNLLLVPAISFCRALNARAANACREVQHG